MIIPQTAQICNVINPGYLPNHYEYREYTGATAEACLREHNQKYPAFPVAVAYWAEVIHTLFIPFEYKRE